MNWRLKWRMSLLQSCKNSSIPYIRLGGIRQADMPSDRVCGSSSSSQLESVGQSVSQSVGRSVGQSVSQSVSRSVGQSVSQSVSRSVGRSVGQSVSQSVSQSVNQPFIQSIKSAQIDLSQSFRWAIRQCNTTHKKSVGRPTNHML